MTLLDSEVRLTGGAPSLPSLSCPGPLSREEPATDFWRGRDCSERDRSFFTAWGLAAPGGPACHVVSRESRLVHVSCLSWLSRLPRRKDSYSCLRRHLCHGCHRCPDCHNCPRYRGCHSCLRYYGRHSSHRRGGCHICHSRHLCRSCHRCQDCHNCHRYHGCHSCLRYYGRHKCHS